MNDLSAVKCVDILQDNEHDLAMYMSPRWMKYLSRFFSNNKKATKSLSISLPGKRKGAYLISISDCRIYSKEKGLAKSGKCLVILLLVNCMSELVHLS